MIQSSRKLEKELIARGLVPPNCRIVDVVIGANAALTVRFECYLDDAQVQKFGEAFLASIEPPKVPADGDKVLVVERA